MARFGAFIAGGLIGAVAALLYAPRKGEETRAMVAERASAFKNEAQDWGAQATDAAQQIYQQAAARGQEVVSEVTSKGQEVASEVAAKSQNAYEAVSSRVQDATEDIKPVFTEKNDELREKIEAARQRIAAQVAKNAEEASAAMADKMNVEPNAEEVGTATIIDVQPAVEEPVSQTAAEEVASQVAPVSEGYQGESK